MSEAKIVEVDKKLVDLFTFILYETAEKKDMLPDTGTFLNKKEYYQILMTKKDEKKSVPKKSDGKPKKVAFSIGSEVKLFISTFNYVKNSRVVSIANEFVKKQEFYAATDSISSFIEESFKDQVKGDGFYRIVDILICYADLFLLISNNIKKGKLGLADIYCYSNYSVSKDKYRETFKEMLSQVQKELEASKKRAEEKKKKAENPGKKCIGSDSSDDESSKKKKTRSKKEVILDETDDEAP